MRRLLAILAVVLAAGVAGARSEVDTGCEVISVTASYSEFFYIATKNDTYSVKFEPDATGAEAVCVIGLQMCSRDESDDGTTLSCFDYQWDTNGDGIADTNLLDGSTTEKTGVKDIYGDRFLRVYASTDPSGTDEPEFTICRRRN